MSPSTIMSILLNVSGPSIGEVMQGMACWRKQGVKMVCSHSCWRNDITKTLSLCEYKGIVVIYRVIYLDIYLGGVNWT